MAQHPTIGGGARRSTPRFPGVGTQSRVAGVFQGQSQLNLQQEALNRQSGQQLLSLLANSGIDIADLVERSRQAGIQRAFVGEEGKLDRAATAQLQEDRLSTVPASTRFLSENVPESLRFTAQQTEDVIPAETRFREEAQTGREAAGRDVVSAETLFLAQNASNRADLDFAREGMRILGQFERDKQLQSIAIQAARTARLDDQTARIALEELRFKNEQLLTEQELERGPIDNFESAIFAAQADVVSQLLSPDAPEGVTRETLQTAMDAAARFLVEANPEAAAESRLGSRYVQKFASERAGEAAIEAQDPAERLLEELQTGQEKSRAESAEASELRAVRRRFRAQTIEDIEKRFPRGIPGTIRGGGLRGVR